MSVKTVKQITTVDLLSKWLAKQVELNGFDWLKQQQHKIIALGGHSQGGERVTSDRRFWDTSPLLLAGLYITLYFIVIKCCII